MVSAMGGHHLAPSGRRFGALVVALFAGATWACGGLSSRDPVGGHGGNAFGSGGSDASGGFGAVGSSTTGGHGGAAGTVVAIPSAGTGGTEVIIDNACDTRSIDAKLDPVSLLVMFDRSGSMASGPVDPVTEFDRWQTSTSALEEFLADGPNTDGVGVALRFFPHDLPAAGCAAPSCDVAACAEPLVEVATLSAEDAPADAHEQALLDAIDTTSPALGTEGGAPTGAALEGAVTWAKARKAAHPEESTAVVFVTDGQPEGCEEQTSSLDSTLSDALDAGVRTFFIGLSDAEDTNLQHDDLNQFAEAGGTKEAYFVQDGWSAATDLVETLVTVRGQAIACDFALPDFTTLGPPLDLQRVEVNYIWGNGFGSTFFTRVSAAEDCGVSSSWYYDDADDPTRIHFCPYACYYARADTKATFSVVEGCALE